MRQCTAHTLFRNTHPLLKVMQNIRNLTQHHCTSYNMYMKHRQVHITSSSVHTTHALHTQCLQISRWSNRHFSLKWTCNLPFHQTGVTLNIDGIHGTSDAHVCVITLVVHNIHTCCIKGLFTNTLWRR